MSWNESPLVRTCSILSEHQWSLLSPEIYSNVCCTVSQQRLLRDYTTSEVTLVHSMKAVTLSTGHIGLILTSW